jgi:hypothetical protein
MGRKPIGETAMTATERQRRRRARLRRGQGYDALCRAWAACDKAERARFLRELRAPAAKRKKERRAERERDLAEKISGGRPMAPAGAITGWLDGLPIISGGPAPAPRASAERVSDK